MSSLIIIRVSFVVLLSAAAWFLSPFDLPAPYGAAAGLGFGLIIILFEAQVRKTTLKRLIGAAIGSLLGIVGAYLISLILGRAFPSGSPTLSFLEILLLLWMGYVGLMVGASKGEMLNLGALGGLPAPAPCHQHPGYEAPRNAGVGRVPGDVQEGQR